MWCDNCDNLSFSDKTTIRITNSGREVLVKKCGYCGSRVETEIVRKKTTRICEDDKARLKTLEELVNESKKLDTGY